VKGTVRNRVYLTRRNLLTLLSKLDRSKSGDVSACTIVKHDISHPTYPCSTITEVTAVEDVDYYSDRGPGFVHPDDESRIGSNFGSEGK
jgi:hypothetical protein